MSTEQELSEKLNSVRNKIPTNPVRSAKSAVKSAVQIASLMKYLNPFLDWLYGIALSAAILKDILDLVLIGSLPVIGTVVTAMASITIWLVMLITGSLFSARWARRIGVLLAGSTVEILFGVNYLPVETTVVIIVFYMTLKQRKEAAEKKEKEAQAQAAELQANYAN